MPLATSHSSGPGVCFFFLMLRPPQRSTLFPYTTLFRSCARAVHDSSRPRPFLRRPRSREERSFRPCAMSRHCGSCYDPLVGGGLFARFLARFSVSRRIEICFSPQCRCATERRLLPLGVAKCLRHVSAYVRDHHARIDHWSGR